MLYSIKYRIVYYIPTYAQIIIFVHMLLYNKQFIIQHARYEHKGK